MDVQLITQHSVDRRPVDDLKQLLSDDEGIVWVDIPELDDDAMSVLTDVFCFHPGAIQDCVRRNTVPKVHIYPDHVFVVLHAPERGTRGHVHYIELDQFVGPNYLVTVHGPTNPAVSKDVPLVDTGTLLRRLSTGKLKPSTPVDLSFTLVTALTNRLHNDLITLTDEVWQLERRVTGGHMGDPELFLEEMFQVRHGLLTVRTMSVLSCQVYGRMVTLEVFGPGRGHSLLLNSEDQFRRVGSMADGQKEYLQGVIEFYQTRTNTKMTIAAERLAVIAAVTLPVTALSSILGMNVIVNESTHIAWLVVLLIVMGVMSLTLLAWAKRRGWW